MKKLVLVILLAAWLPAASAPNVEPEQLDMDAMFGPVLGQPPMGDYWNARISAVGDTLLVCTMMDGEFICAPFKQLSPGKQCVERRDIFDCSGGVLSGDERLSF